MLSGRNVRNVTASTKRFVSTGVKQARNQLTRAITGRVHLKTRGEGLFSLAHFCGSGTRRERARAPAAHHTGPYGTRAPFLAPTKRNLSPSYSTSIPADTTSISIAAILLRSYRYALLVAHGHIRHVFLPRAPRAARHSIASLRGTRTETRRPQRLTFAPLMVALQRAGDGLERRGARVV